MKKLCTLALALLMLLGLMGCTPEQFGSTEKQNETISDDVVYYADIVIADYGTVTVKLDQKSAPITVENFVNLAKRGVYTGSTFHRIIEGFMMQGGIVDADVDSIVGEFTGNGYDNPLLHTRGAISMARTQFKDSANSQFFIVHEDSPHLDGQYACFGYVTEGIEVVDAVCTGVTPSDGNGSIPEDQQPVITSITIREE